MIEDAIKIAVAEVIQPLMTELFARIDAPQTTAEPRYSDDQLLTEEQVGALLGVSLPTLRRLRNRKEAIPYVKIGSSARYKMADIRAYVRRQAVKVIDEEGRVR